MAILSDYTNGTIAIANGSTTVTGVNTAWNLTELQEGDLILVNNRSAVIQSVDGATSITLTRPWTDAAVPAGTPYRARYMADAARYTAIAKELLRMLASGNVEALAGLTGAVNKLPYFTGAATMGLADFTALGRSIVNKADTLSLLAFDGPFGPVLGGSAPAPSEANVGLTDGDFNTITVPGVYTIAGSWANGVNTAAPAALTGILMVVARRFGNLYYQFYFQSDIVWVRSSTAPATSWTAWTRLTQETNAGEFLTNKTIANASPVFTVRDTDTGAEGRLNGASTVGSLFIEADRTDLFPNAILGLTLSGSSKFQLTKNAGATLAYSGDGQQVLTFATERSWVIRQRGTGSSAMLSFENTSGKSIDFSAETTYTGPQISLIPWGGTSTQILCGTISSSGHTTPSYSFQNATGTGMFGYNSATLGFSAASARTGFINTSGLCIGGRTTTATSQTGTGVFNNANGAIYSFLAASSNGSPLQVYLDADTTLVNGGRIASNSTGLSMPSTSDYRLKENVSDLVDVSIDADEFMAMSNNMLRIMALRPVTYTWKDNRVPGISTGFIAHEMQQVMPHAVSGEKDAMEDIGIATRKGALIPGRTVTDKITEDVPLLDKEGNAVVLPDGTPVMHTVIIGEDTRVIPDEYEPDEVYENTPRSMVSPGFEFEKTGEIIDPQAVDHVKIVPDLTAAFQELTMLVLKERREKQALETRLAAIEAHLNL